MKMVATGVELPPPRTSITSDRFAVLVTSQPARQAGSRRQQLRGRSKGAEVSINEAPCCLARVLLLLFAIASEAIRLLLD